jgi:hypothetical protein
VSRENDLPDMPLGESARPRGPTSRERARRRIGSTEPGRRLAGSREAERRPGYSIPSLDDALMYASSPSPTPRDGGRDEARVEARDSDLSKADCGSMGLVIRDGGRDGVLVRAYSSRRFASVVLASSMAAGTSGIAAAMCWAIGVLSIGVALLLSDKPLYVSATGLSMLERADAGWLLLGGIDVWICGRRLPGPPCFSGNAALVKKVLISS